MPKMTKTTTTETTKTTKTTKTTPKMVTPKRHAKHSSEQQQPPNQKLAHGLAKRAKRLFAPVDAPLEQA